MSHVNKALGLVLSFLLPFVSLFLSYLDVTQTQIDFFCFALQDSTLEEPHILEKYF